MQNTRIVTRIFMACAACFIGMLVQGAQKAQVNAAHEKPSPEKVAEGQMRVFGGFIPDRRKQAGEIYVIDTQDAADGALIDSALGRFTELVRVDFKKEKGAFDVFNPTVKGNATLFVVDSPNLPMSLVATEARWAMMNVAQLKSDKRPFFEARVKKETFRVLALLLGVGGSKYPQCITGCVTKPEDLDEIFEVKMPFEFEQRFEQYLPGLGITPWKRVMYRRAVQEGWAPAPTNEFQQAIWDKAHAIPEKPMKIEFDPKKGR